MGESDKPDSGYDKKTMAVDIHELVKKLGYKSIDLAGHDIGLMVAYAYAAQFGAEVKKLALMDALLPGVEPVWSDFSGKAWWFGFFARPVSGYLVQGKEGAFLTDFWPVVGHVNDAFTKEERDEFIRQHIQSTRHSVLISPSLHTGLDLRDDLSRFQVITKVPYPNITDKWIYAKRKGDAEWYYWQTALKLIQAYGRSVRSKDDWAKTYVLDSAFNYYVRKNERILPKWFINAIKRY
jgi:hypothetical protein